MANVPILYCGSSLTRSLYEKLLHLKVRPILMPADTPAEDILGLNPLAIMITGSPEYVNGPHAPRIDTDLYGAGIPMLGICYGMQLMAVDLGGEVQRMGRRERECVQMKFDHYSTLFQDFAEEDMPVWMLHVCKVTRMPPGFVATGNTKRTEIAAMEDINRAMFAVQFHPEHIGSDASSQAGTAVIWNFLNGICGHQIDNI